MTVLTRGHEKAPAASPIKATGANPDKITQHAREVTRNPAYNSKNTRCPREMSATAIRLCLAARGFYLFPLVPDEKRPLENNPSGKATRDPEKLKDWPTGSGWGVACGPSNLVVVDLDSHGGTPPEEWDILGARDGKDVFHILWKTYDDRPAPNTFTVATPSGGRHLYFRAPEGVELRNTAGRIGWQVDTRAGSGYVVGPGSTLPNGRYSVAHDPGELELLPVWLTAMLGAPKRVKRGPRVALPSMSGHRVAALAKTVAIAPQGKRNPTLYWAACALAEDKILTQENAAILMDAGLSAGLEQTECMATIYSAHARFSEVSA